MKKLDKSKTYDLSNLNDSELIMLQRGMMKFCGYKSIQTLRECSLDYILNFSKNEWTISYCVNRKNIILTDAKELFEDLNNQESRIQTIKAEELRIGNTVEQGIVYELRNTVAKIKYNDRYSLIAYENLNPIPLNEEILLKCGFDYSSKLSDNDCMVYYLDNGLEIVWAGYLCVDINSLFIPLADTELKHLHELENLYKILTKQELEINL